MRAGCRPGAKRAARTSGEAAFRSLFDRYEPWCWRAARRLTGSDADAGDAVQEAFIALLRAFPAFELRGKLTTYLYAVIRNRAAAGARRRRPLTLPHDAAGPSIFDDPATPDISAVLQEAVKTLPPAQREVLFLRLVEQMTVNEVAAALDIPAGTVKSRLHAAVYTLRGNMELNKIAGSSNAAGSGRTA